MELAKKEGTVISAD